MADDRQDLNLHGETFATSPEEWGPSIRCALSGAEENSSQWVKAMMDSLFTVVNGEMSMNSGKDNYVQYQSSEEIFP